MYYPVVLRFVFYCQLLIKHEENQYYHEKRVCKFIYVYFSGRI